MKLNPLINQHLKSQSVAEQIIDKHLFIPANWGAELKTDAKTRNKYISLLMSENSESTTITLYRNEAIIGYIWAKRESERGAKIISFWVAVDMRRLGVGMLLKKCLQLELKKSGYRGVSSRVHNSNTQMLLLNRKLGYEVKATNENYTVSYLSL